MQISITSYVPILNLVQKWAENERPGFVAYENGRTYSLKDFEEAEKTKTSIILPNDCNSKDVKLMEFSSLEEEMVDLLQSGKDVGGYYHIKTPRADSHICLGDYIQDGRMIENLRWIISDQLQHWIHAHTPVPAAIATYDVAIEQTIKPLLATPGGKNRLYDWYMLRKGSGIKIPYQVSVHKRPSFRISLEKIIEKFDLKAAMKKTGRKKR